MKFFERVQGDKRNKCWDFGCDPDHHADRPIINRAITQQILSGFWWNLQDSSVMIQEQLLIFFVAWLLWWLSKSGTWTIWEWWAVLAGEVRAHWVFLGYFVGFLMNFFMNFFSETLVFQYVFSVAFDVSPSIIHSFNYIYTDDWFLPLLDRVFFRSCVLHLICPNSTDALLR